MSCNVFIWVKIIFSYLQCHTIIKISEHVHDENLLRLNIRCKQTRYCDKQALKLRINRPQTFPFASNGSLGLLSSSSAFEDSASPWSQSGKGLVKLRSSISDSEPATSFSLFDMLSPIATAARQGQAYYGWLEEKRVLFYGCCC